MKDLETQKLRNDDVLLVILSGLSEGRYNYNNLKTFIREVIDEERTSGEVEMPPLIEGVYRGLEGAWTSNVAYLRGIEPIGHGNDYVLSSEVGVTAQHLKEMYGISDEDYDYLRSIGRRVEEIIEERAW